MALKSILKSNTLFSCRSQRISEKVVIVWICVEKKSESLIKGVKSSQKPKPSHALEFYVWLNSNHQTNEYTLNYNWSEFERNFISKESEFKSTSKTYARNHVIHGTYVCFIFHSKIQQIRNMIVGLNRTRYLYIERRR